MSPDSSNEVLQGHKSNDCPLRKIANVAEEIEEEEEEKEPESSVEFEDEQIMVARDEGEYVNCVVLLSPKQADHSQRYQIFENYVHYTRQSM